MKESCSQLRGRCSRILAALALALAVFACQTIAGVEERSLGPCGEYCDAVMQVCQGEYTVYSSTETCMGVCELLPPGDSLEPDGSNSVACRLAEVKRASVGEPDVHCPRAGPAAGGSCGAGACESYCMLYEQACGSDWFTYESMNECIGSCAALRDTGEFDAIHDHDGDTLQCRLVHVSSATVVPEGHCEHARLAPPTAPCADPADEAPDCSDYCRVITAACQDESAQYDDVDQCEAVCELLDLGLNADTSNNTVGCRLYHAYNALVDPWTHCSHAGPTGDGHCGAVDDSEQAPCDTYCTMVEQACPTEFSASFGAIGCVESCSDLDESGRDSEYTVLDGEAGGETLACRMLYASRAVNDPSSCAAALGGAPCD